MLKEIDIVLQVNVEWLLTRGYSQKPNASNNHQSQPTELGDASYVHAQAQTFSQGDCCFKDC